MNKVIQDNLQINLISLVLLFLIPITLSLGVNFFFPKIDQQKIYDLQEIYVKKNVPNFNHSEYLKSNFNVKEKDNPKNIYVQSINEWKTSEEYTSIIKQNKVHTTSKTAIFLIVITLLLISLYFIPIHILQASLIIACLYLYSDLFLFNAQNNASATTQAISALIFLMLITYQAYRDQNT